jgi:hypothetical protein
MAWHPPPVGGFEMVRGNTAKGSIIEKEHAHIDYHHIMHDDRIGMIGVMDTDQGF